MPVVHMPHLVYTGICLQGEQCYPKEACGLLTGVFLPGGDVQIEGFYPSPNVAADPLHAFTLDPATQFSVQRAARRGRHTVIGLYHSHPNGQAQLSALDKKNAALLDFLWMIMAITPTTATVIRCYYPSCYGGEYIEMPVVVS